MLKRPEDLTDGQHDTLLTLKRTGGAVWRGYQLKEALRAIFDEDLRYTGVGVLLDRSWAGRWHSSMPRR